MSANDQGPITVSANQPPVEVSIAPSVIADRPAAENEKPALRPGLQGIGDLFGVNEALYTENDAAPFKGLTAQLPGWTDDEVANEIAAQQSDYDRQMFVHAANPDAAKARLFQVLDNTSAATMPPDVLKKKAAAYGIPESDYLVLAESKHKDILSLQQAAVDLVEKHGVTPPLVKRMFSQDEAANLRWDLEAASKVQAALHSRYDSETERFLYTLKGGVQTAFVDLPAKALSFAGKTMEAMQTQSAKNLDQQIAEEKDPLFRNYLLGQRERFNEIRAATSKKAALWEKLSKDISAEYGQAELTGGDPTLNFGRRVVAGGLPALGAFVVASSTAGVGAAAVAFGASTGEETRQSLVDAGVDPELTLALSLTSAGIATAANMMQGEKWLDLMKFSGKGWVAFGRTAGDSVAEGAAEMVEVYGKEGAISAGKYSTGNYTGEDAWKDFTRATGEGFENALSAVLLTGILGAPHVMKGAKNQVLDTVFSKKIKALGQAIKGAKIENPTAFKAAVQDMTKEAGTNTAYASAADVEKLFQNRLSDLDTMLVNTGLREEFERSKAGGADMKISVADFHLAMKDSADLEPVAALFSRVPEGQTVGERDRSHEFLTERADEIKKLRGQMTAMEARGEMPEAVKAFRNDMLNIGHSAEEANQITEVFFAGALVSARRRKQTVEEWLADANVRAIINDQVANIREMKRTADDMRDRARAKRLGADAAAGKPAAPASGAVVVDPAGQGETDGAPALHGHRWAKVEATDAVVAHLAATKDRGYAERAIASVNARAAEVEAARQARRGPNRDDWKDAEAQFLNSAESLAVRAREIMGESYPDQPTKEQHGKLEVALHRAMEDHPDSVSGVPVWMSERFAEFFAEAEQMGRNKKAVKSYRSAKIRAIAEANKAALAGHDAELDHLDAIKARIEAAAAPEMSPETRIDATYPAEEAAQRQEQDAAPEMVKVDPLVEIDPNAPWVNEEIEVKNGVDSMTVRAGAAAEMLNEMDPAAAAPLREALRKDLAERGHDVVVKEKTVGAEKYYEDPTDEQNDKDFARELNSLGFTKRNIDTPIRVGNTPKVLVEAGAPKLPLSITVRVINKVTGGSHSISKAALRDLPAQMRSPVMVFRSKKPAGALVVITEMMHEGSPIIAAVHVSERHGKTMVNAIASVYDKSNLHGIQGWINEGRIAYVSKEKSPAWLQSLGLQLPLESATRSSTDTVSSGDAPVKPESYEQSTRERAAAKLAQAEADQAALKERVRQHLSKAKVLVTPEVERQAMRAYLSAMQRRAAGLEAFAQPAYHGTPHRGIEKFSLEKVGTGEGHQAYGYGLYFAGSKDVAEYYRKNLKDMSAIDAINKRMDAIVKELDKYRMAEYGKYRDPKGYELKAEYDKLMSDRDEIRLSPGQLHKVEVPEDGDLLDWDKPLAEQSDKVKAGLKRLGVRDISEILSEAQAQYESVAKRINDKVAKIVAEEGRAAVGPYLDSDEGKRDHEEVRQAYRDFQTLAQSANWTGKEIYYSIAPKNGDKVASERLLSVGIPGLRYLDGSSRRRGEGSHNYVIWDESAIQNLETYYQDKVQDVVAEMLREDGVEAPAPRGEVEFADGATIIRAVKGKADLSTVLHELNHIFVRDLRLAVQQGLGGEQAKQDLETLSKYCGVDLLAVDFDKMTDSEKKKYSEGMELLARSWEQWAREGKAPSAALDSAFSHFSSWLAAIYKDIRAYVGADMHDDVRGVFERMLASDQEIKEAEAYFDTRQRLENLAGATPDEIKLLAQQRERAREATVKKGIKRSVSLFLQALGGKKAFREQAEAEVDARPVQKAAAEITGIGGMRRAEVEALVGKPTADAILASHGEDVFGPAIGVEALDSIARERGYASPEDLLTDLGNAKGRKAAVEARIDEITAGHVANAEKVLQEGGGAPGDESYHTDARLLLLESELAVLRKRVKNTAGSRAKAIQTKAIRDAAKAVVRKGSIRDASQTSRFSAAERKSAAAAIKAATEASAEQTAADRASQDGDDAGAAMHYEAASKLWEQAVQHKEQQLFNNAMVLESVAARTEALEFRRRYSDRKLTSAMKGMEYNFREALKDMLTSFGISNSKKMAPDVKRAEIYIPSAKDTPDAEGVPDMTAFLPDLRAHIPEWIVKRVKPEGFSDWRDLTVQQMRDLDDAMQAMLVQGRGSLRALESIYGKTIDELAQESIKRMGGRPDRPVLYDTDKFWHRIWNWTDKFWAGLICPENQADMWDGNPSLVGQEFGPIRKAFIAIRACEMAQGKMMEDLQKLLQPHLNTLSRAKARLAAKFGADLFDILGLEVPEKLKKARGHAKWNAERLFMLALNTGNDANLYALQNGYGFTDEQIEIIRAQFTREEWDAMQGIWDALDTLFPDLEKTTFRLTNKHIAKEAPMTFATKTDGGLPISVRGGYFPLRYDGLISQRMGQVQEFNEMKDFAAGMMAVHGSAKPEKGMAIERARDEDGNAVVKQPPMLQISQLADHLYKTTRYITHAEALHDFDALTRHEEWRETFLSKFGMASYGVLRQWLNRQANPNAGQSGHLWSIFSKIRGLETIRALGLNIRTGLKQRLGMFNAAAAMGDASRTKANSWAYLMGGVRELGFTGGLGIMNQKIEAVHQMSRYMKERDKGAERELRDMIVRLEEKGQKIINIGGKEFVLADIKDKMFHWIRMNDRGTATAVWLGSYKMARAGDANFDIAGLTEEEAHSKSVEFADAMAATQASGFTADLGLIQTDPLWRFFTMFMSGVIRQGSRMYQYVDAVQMGQKTKAQFASNFAMEMAMPAWVWMSLSSAMIYAISGGDDEKDQPAWWEWLVQPAENAVAWIPGLREIGGTFRYGQRSGGGIADVGLSLKHGTKAAKEGEFATAAWDLWKSAEYFVGVPVSNVVRQAGQVQTIANGGKKNDD
jgi:hypothetical protein